MREEVKGVRVLMAVEDMAETETEKMLIDEAVMVGIRRRQKKTLA